MGLCSSEDFFTCCEPLAPPEISRFQSIRGRYLALKNFFQKLAIIPLAFLCKLGKMACICLIASLSGCILIFTLCLSKEAREFFANKLVDLAKEAADWILWPISVFYCLFRLLLATLVHPGFYFKRL